MTLLLSWLALSVVFAALWWRAGAVLGWDDMPGECPGEDVGSNKNHSCGDVQ
jgi:hypothetical protein